MRGRDERGHDLIIARDYLSHGLRERACELVDLDLGPRSDEAIEQRLRAEVGQERLTSIDRALIREADANVLVSTEARGAFDQAIRMGRLKKLERLGLATQMGATHWRLVPDLADTLRRMGERGDIIRTMQRAYATRGHAPAVVDQVIYYPAAPGARPLVGRIVERGLADEHADRHYMIVDAADGRSHYVAIGKGENVGPQKPGTVVRVTPVETGIRQADRTVAEIAATNGGRYTIDAHLRHDPNATEAFAQAHVRRLEAMRRLTKAVEREPDGSWVIAPDHLDRAAAYEVARAADRPVTVEALSTRSLEKLVDADAATWLDRELVAPSPEPLRDAGFGHDARDAQVRRRQWLTQQGLAEDRDGQWTPRTGMIAILQRRELLQVAGQLSDELGLPFAEAKPGQPIEGRFARAVEMEGRRHALIERSRDFTLVPWRPALERQMGKTVSGIMRDGGGIHWSFGRQRSGPGIS